YRALDITSTGYTGIHRATITSDDADLLWGNSAIYVDDITSTDLTTQPANTGLILASDQGSSLARIAPSGRLIPVTGDKNVFGVKGRSAEQRIAIEHLTDPKVGIVSLGGRAGTGKSALALAAGLDAVLERQQHRKVMVFRPLYAVGGQELGYLPGDQQEKMNPWGQAVFDTLGSIVSQNVLDEVEARGIVEVLPLTHIRGRSLHDAFVIVD